MTSSDFANYAAGIASLSQAIVMPLTALGFFWIARKILKMKEAVKKKFDGATGAVRDAKNNATRKAQMVVDHMQVPIDGAKRAGGVILEKGNELLHVAVDKGQAARDLVMPFAEQASPIPQNVVGVLDKFRKRFPGPAE